MALALAGAIASSDFADAALVDLGVLVECDAQETLCSEDDLEPREQIGIVATASAAKLRASLRAALFVCRLLHSVSLRLNLTGLRIS
jgi:hypothetical protein